MALENEGSIFPPTKAPTSLTLLFFLPCSVMWPPSCSPVMTGLSPP